jgi:hypothetical protein
MTTLFLDGFDLYDDGLNRTHVANAWDVGWRDKPTITTGRYGGKALQQQTTRNKGKVKRTIIFNTANVFMGVAVKTSVLPPSEVILAGITSTTIYGYHASCTLLTDGKLRLDVNGLTVTTATAVITAATWHYIELNLDTAVSGSFEVRVDGVVKASVSGDTDGGIEIINAIGLTGFWKPSVHGTLPTILFDDVYAGDDGASGGYLGDIRVDYLLVNDTTIPAADVPGYPLNSTYPLSGMSDWSVGGEFVGGGFPELPAPDWRSRCVVQDLVDIGRAGATVVANVGSLYYEPIFFGYDGTAPIHVGDLVYHPTGSVIDGTLSAGVSAQRQLLWGTQNENGPLPFLGLWSFAFSNTVNTETQLNDLQLEGWLPAV